MTNKCFSIIFLLLPLLGLTQERNWYMQGGYLGQMITHPGISIGVLTDLNPSLRAGMKIGTYYHHRMHTGVLITPSLEWLHTRPKGFQMGASLSPGFLRTVVPAVYESGENGQTERKWLSGTNHFVVSPAIRLGKDFSFSKGLPLSWYIQPQLMIQAPYFQGINPLFFIEAGITYQLTRS